jgi:hypothetical protein
MHPMKDILYRGTPTLPEIYIRHCGLGGTLRYKSVASADEDVSRMDELEERLRDWEMERNLLIKQHVLESNEDGTVVTRAELGVAPLNTDPAKPIVVFRTESEHLPEELLENLVPDNKRGKANEYETLKAIPADLNALSRTRVEIALVGRTSTRNQESADGRRVSTYSRNLAGVTFEWQAGNGSVTTNGYIGETTRALDYQTFPQAYAGELVPMRQGIHRAVRAINRAIEKSVYFNPRV